MFPCASVVCVGTQFVPSSYRVWSSVGCGNASGSQDLQSDPFYLLGGGTREIELSLYGFNIVPLESCVHLVVRYTYSVFAD